MVSVSNADLSRLNELPRSTAESLLRSMPVTTALLAGRTALSPANYAHTIQAICKETNDLIASGKLANAEQLYQANTGSVYKADAATTSRHIRNAALASTTSDVSSRRQGDDLTKINQLAYSGQLGNGDSTLSRAGCMLASLTMSANDLRRSQGRDDVMNLAQANETVRDSGGFSGSNLTLSTAARSLGLNLQSRQRATRSTMSSAVSQMQDRPANTRLMVGVDYKAGSNSCVSQADHYIAVKSVGDDGTLRATDPAGGRDITFTRDSDGVYRSGKYAVSEVSVLTQNDPTLAARGIPRRA